VTEALARVAFVARSESRLFMLEFARLLKERHGSTLHLYCGSAQEVRFYQDRSRDGLFASVTDAGTPLKYCRDDPGDPDRVIERSRTFEELTGATINHLAVANRHLGRGYALGGFYHPRSRQSENTSYIQMLHAYNETLAFWEREYKDKAITLVLNGGKEAAVMARAHGLPFRGLAGSRYKNYHYWAWNEYQENPRIEALFRGDGDLPPAELEAPYLAHRTNRQLAMKSFGAVATARRLGYRALRHAYWHLRGYEAARNYYLRDILGMNWRRWSDYRRLSRLATTTLKDLEGQRFVFFPLHVEPEAALQVISPEHFYQLSAIAALSRDLPAGTKLAVKEHFAAIGRRPADFYDQIAEFKNVVLLDTWELGFDVVRQADAVATICGSAGFEGAIMGKPVVTFGRHNTYNFLPHVSVVADETNLKRHLRDALSAKHDGALAREFGVRFLGAVVAASFDMKQYDYIELQDFDPQTVSDACDALARGLDISDPEMGLKVAI